MNLITNEIKESIDKNIKKNLLLKKYDIAIINISQIIDDLYKNIPDNKRISYGRVYTIKILSKYVYKELIKLDNDVFEISSTLFVKSNEFKSRGVSLGMLSYYGISDYQKVLHYFEFAAGSSDWNVREFSQMFFRKLIKKHPEEIHRYLLKLAKSKDSNIRRFVSETLRPVQENKWFYNDPNYSLSIIKHLFKEKAAYPRTSVGNNLSDLARKRPDIVYKIVRDLVATNDKNSYWIAYRACRNLVKKEPIKVMDILQVDEYKYKKRIHKRSDYKRN